MDGLRQLGFHTCGFGCMSCIGNSGPVQGTLHRVANDIELASVLSGNRNFEGRISPDVAQNYLAAPAVVVAYALAGTMDVDLEHDALGCDAQGPAGAPGRHLALRRRGGRAGDRARHGRPVCDGHARPVRGGRRVGSARRGAERCVLVGRPVHLCAPASLLRRHGSLSRRAGADRGGSRAGAFGGLHHDRPHLARRVHRRRLSGRALPARTRRRSCRFQHVRVAPRQTTRS